MIRSHQPSIYCVFHHIFVIEPALVASLPNIWSSRSDSNRLKPLYKSGLHLQSFESTLVDRGGIEPLKTRNVQGTSVTHHPAQNYYLGGFTSHHVEHSCNLLNDWSTYASSITLSTTSLYPSTSGMLDVKSNRVKEPSINPCFQLVMCQFNHFFPIANPFLLWFNSVP